MRLVQIPVLHAPVYQIEVLPHQCWSFGLRCANPAPTELRLLELRLREFLHKDLHELIKNLLLCTVRRSATIPVNIILLTAMKKDLTALIQQTKTNISNIIDMEIHCI